MPAYRLSLLGPPILTGPGGPVLLTGTKAWRRCESQGNPLCAVELMRELQESAPPAGRSSDALREVPLPRTAQGLIQGRVAWLPPGARDLLGRVHLSPAGTDRGVAAGGGAG